MGAPKRVPIIISYKLMCLFGLLTYVGQYASVYV